LLVLTRTKPKTQVFKDNAASAADFANALARDRKFRKQLLSAMGHGVTAKRRAKSRIGFLATANRLASDDMLKGELRSAVKSLEKAWTRVEKKRSHKLRTTLIVVGVIAAASAAATKLKPSSKP